MQERLLQGLQRRELLLVEASEALGFFFEVSEIVGKAPLLIGTGGSIPAVGAIQRILGMDALLVGFGLDDDCVHSPNEKFELECYRNAIRSHAAILGELAKLSR